MPQPNKAESELIGTNDSALVYFTLRGIMRLQLQHGTRISPLTPEKQQTTPRDIREAAQTFAKNCLTPVDNTQTTTEVLVFNSEHAK